MARMARMARPKAELTLSGEERARSQRRIAETVTVPWKT